MIFSKPSAYAVRALIFLANSPNQRPILSTNIAKAQSIPGSYLVKILGTLTGAKLIQSTRGPGGGFSLTKDPANITLKQVVTLFDRLELFEECVLGSGQCTEDEDCPIHKFWSTPRRTFLNFLETTTLADMAKTEGTINGRSIFPIDPIPNRSA